jgi:hypothetical protein
MKLIAAGRIFLTVSAPAALFEAFHRIVKKIAGMMNFYS